jgi:tRNA/rRNA methyltransferase
MSLENCRVVLVRPQFAGNIGATARVMRNMGLSQLVLVAPEADPADKSARQFSTHGQTILQNARIVADLGEALADCTLVAGTSARTAGLFRGQSCGLPEEILPQVVEACSAGQAALVFGPERTGLSNAEVTRCHYLIHIPTDRDHGALNLAQAVAITLYELRRAWLRRTEGEPSQAEPPASFADQERMFAESRQALAEIHFLFGEKADALMHAVRHLIGRAKPTLGETKILIGLARQIRWYVANTEPPEDMHR